VTLEKLPTEWPGVNGPLVVSRPKQVSPDDLGMYTNEDRVIQVQKSLRRLVAWRVFFHEWAHAALDDCGVALTHDQEEAVCQAIAAGRMAELLTAS
jgi:hypothetical protein